MESVRLCGVDEDDDNNNKDNDNDKNKNQNKNNSRLTRAVLLSFVQPQVKA